MNETETTHTPIRRRLRNFATGGMLLALAACGDSNSNHPGDPLLQYEWYVQNVGQDVFTGVPGTPGIDLDVMGAWHEGITGSGVNVMVVDSGVEIAHPDLKVNINSSMLHNFDTTAANPDDPTPAPPGSDIDAHGTEVAGIIAAAADNGIGGRGVAFNAALGAVRYLCDEGCGTAFSMLSTYGGAPYSEAVDVFNASYGRTPALPEQFSMGGYESFALQHLETMRNGLGALIVQSAGNDFLNDASKPAALCTNANAHDVTCFNANSDPQTAMPEVVTVAAVNASGVHSSYSSAGSNILVAGLGGEFGLAASLPRFPAGPALLTTDLTGCSQGAASTGTVNPYSNPFNVPGSTINGELNADCDYTATMNGTSAAAPTVSAVVALMLQVNPQLTWRDIRTILMKTARRIDADRVPTTVEPASGQQYVPEPAWTQNAAGYWFDNRYGFGLVDAAAAVNMARGYGPALRGSMLADTAEVDPSADGTGESVPQSSTTGLEVDLAVGGAVKSVEFVQVMIDMPSANPSDLAIELVSPSGTRSVLQNAYNGFLNTSVEVGDWLLASNAFNGESAQGTWKLRFIDVDTRLGDPMLAQSVRIAVQGP
ncbi:S8 family serine peptidase [Paraburkholderia sp. CNPSo 3274]|uniref:S8 family serine peptidase n=1 Tax=Paraburkholderia sp. CNPSo 3274 TaxID=2940932 RepID=UPI0026603E05|nr:S8 family serine peptidase [Paraburkholderia sp. CNPSo 3274]